MHLDLPKRLQFRMEGVDRISFTLSPLHIAYGIVSGFAKSGVYHYISQNNECLFSCCQIQRFDGLHGLSSGATNRHPAKTSRIK